MQKINLLLIGFHRDTQEKIINRLLVKFSFAFVYHLSHNNIKLTAPDNNTKIVNQQIDDIMHGNFSVDNCLPLDSEILEKMRPYEYVALKMMDRFEDVAGLKYSKFDNRYDLYLKQLRFWNDVIIKNKINLHLDITIPHEAYDYIIYGLCKVYNIPVLTFTQAQMHDITAPLEDIHNWGHGSNNEYQRLLAEYNKNPLAEVVLTKSALSEWQLRRENITPFYLPSQKLLDQPILYTPITKSIAKKIINPYSLLRYIYLHARQKIRDKILRLKYNKIAVPPDYSKKFVYFPLHMQPECTTCPMGGYMMNQDLVAIMIANSLPEGVWLYVKENRVQKFQCRGYNYYKKILASSPKIRFVPVTEDTHQLEEKSVAVATITGTAGWEALFKKKPVLIFGDCFYDNAPGVFKIRNFKDCRAAVKSIFSQEFKYDERKLKIYLQAIQNSYINCCSDTVYFKVSSLSVEESNNNLYLYLEKYLSNLIDNKKFGS